MVGVIKRRLLAVADVLDEDDFASDSAVAPPSQQSTKAYVDAAIISAGAGDVIGPVSATDGHIARFDGTTGKKIKGGLALDTDSALAADSDTRVPSQKAVKTYVDGAVPTTEEIQDIAGAMWTGNTETFIAITYQDTDGTIDAAVPVKDEDDMASDSASHLATQQSIKAYVDTAVGAIDTPTTEEIQDIVGGMFSDSQTFITATYQDFSGKMALIVPVKDEDDMASDSSSFLPTQQSVKAYVDTQVGAISVPVDSVFGRTGDVVAATSDYDASQVDNDSDVTGSTVKDALDALDTALDGKQPLDADLTAIAGLTTTAAGRSVLAVSDPDVDRPLFWDDSAGGFTTDISQIATNSNPASSAAFLTVAPSTGQLERVLLSTLTQTPHNQVRLATTANITIATALNGGDSIDGQTLVAGNRVLVKNQTDAEENGVYVAGSSPARAGDYPDFDSHCGVLISVQDGTENKNTVWRGTSTYGGSLDFTNITFEQVPVTASALLTAIKTVDGTGSGLDADLLDGNEAAAFAAASHSHTASDITDFAEAVSDQIGTMVAGNTETGITVTYQDADNTLDFVVDTASDTTKGIVELATEAETLTGTDTTRAVTPAGTKAYVDQAAADLVSLTELYQAVENMLTMNTETFISVTYRTDDDTIDFVVPVKDEDDFASDSASHLATQQSIKAYVDAAVVSGSGAPMPSSDGIIVRTSSTTTAAREIEAGDGISVSDGDGVSDNPTISVDSSVARLSGATFTGNIAVQKASPFIYLTDTTYASSQAAIAYYQSQGNLFISADAGNARAGSAIYLYVDGVQVGAFTGGGGLRVGASPTGGDKGAGTINSGGTIYENNVEVAKIVASGSYTPTLTNGVNISAASVVDFHYIDFGDMVLVWGGVTIDPVSAGTGTRFDMSLPTTASLSDTYQLAGAAGGFFSESLRIRAVDPTHAICQWTPVSANSAGFSILFAYMKA